MGRIGRRALVLALLGLALAVPPALAAPAIEGEFPVQGLGTNNKLVEGPDGNVWATVENGAKNVARITPSGTVTEYELGVSGASGIARGPEGALWITDNGGVTKFSPANPEVGQESTGVSGVTGNSPIVAGPDGQMWLATSEKVIHFPPGEPTNATPIAVPGLAPTDIDVAGSLLVVADGSGSTSRIATFTSAGVEKDYPLVAGGASQGVAGASSGLIGYSQQLQTPEQVGLITPPTAAPAIELPGGVGDPFGIALGSDEAFWAVLSGKDGLERFTKTGELSFLGGLGAGSMARQIASGPGNTLWVSVTKIGEEAVARISGLEPPTTGGGSGGETGTTGMTGTGTTTTTTTTGPPAAAAAPETQITKGPKGKVKTTAKWARVRFRFSSSAAGASFECRVVRQARKKAKASKTVPFRACKSPRAFRVAPSRYRFEVRAVLGGQVDATPAKRFFRIVRIAANRH